MFQEPKLIQNALRTPDGTVLQSHHRYDYKTHIDAITGKKYMIDGGLDYIRRSAWGDEEVLTLYSDSAHSVQRDCITWGSYGKNGDEPLKYLTIAEMSDEHIKAVLTKCNPYPIIRDCMVEELKHRGVR